LYERSPALARRVSAWKKFRIAACAIACTKFSDVPCATEIHGEGCHGLATKRIIMIVTLAKINARGTTNKGKRVMG
jgi:hypothetical protein